MRASMAERLPAASLVPLGSWTEETMAKICSAALLLCIAGPTLADPPAEVMSIMREPDLKFVPSKVVQGASQALIWGNPAKPGETYIVRNRFSPGVFSPPHFHPETRYI